MSNYSNPPASREGTMSLPPSSPPLQKIVGRWQSETSDFCSTLFAKHTSPEMDETTRINMCFAFVELIRERLSAPQN